MVEAVYQQHSSEKSERWYHSLKPSRFFTPNRKFHKAVLQWLGNVLDFLETHTSGSELNERKPKEVLWQTIVGGYTTDDGAIGSDISQAFDYWYQAHRELSGKDKSSLLASVSRKPEFYDQAQRFEDLKASSLHDQPIFGTTQKRYLGHGPKGMLPGDIICIVKGALTPFLLRRNALDIDGEGHDQNGWRLVGDCFVHGLMYGESLTAGEMRDFALI